MMRPSWDDLSVATRYEPVVKLQGGAGTVCTSPTPYTTTPGKEIVMPRQYIRVPAEERFWSKVDRNGPIPDYAPHLGPCWIWTGGKAGDGYGQIFVNGKKVYAHRFARELLVGPIELRDVDHLCRVHACVRPEHTEPVTHSENAIRGFAGQAWAAIQAAKTSCPYGHPYEGNNLYMAPNGHRACRECRNRASRAYKARRRGCHK